MKKPRKGPKHPRKAPDNNHHPLIPVRPPRTLAQYNAKPEKFREAYERVLKVIAKMRAEKTSLQKAAQEHGVSPRTIQRWAAPVLQKRSNGKWAAKKTDNLLRVLTVPTSDGTREIGVRGSMRASQLGAYWAALRKYLQTGDASRLEKFRGKSIKAADGTEIPLLTDRRELNRIAAAGLFSFESLYSRSA